VSEATTTASEGGTAVGAPTPADLGFAPDDPAFTADPYPALRPDELDLRRRPNPSVSFGAGIHYCLGAPLARLELSIAFETLLRRLPRMEPVTEPAWKPTFVLRGLETLRVRA
jgi:cytochrome P450